MMQRILLTGMLCLSIVCGGCFGSGGDGKNAQAIDTKNRGKNAPQITGSPPQSIHHDQAYEFTPTSTDVDGDVLSFTIQDKPVWASFDESTGRLSGTPGADHVGTYTGISISVSDGLATTSLPAFAITVAQSAQGSVTLSWLPPTENSDGSALTDLTGYRIYVGLNAADLSRVIILNNAGLTRYVVEDLSPATWHFAMTSVNASGVESERSATIQKDVG